MTIDRAIEILTMWKKGKWAGDPNELDQAEKLGIESLRRLKSYRDKKFPVLGEELPGETAK